MKKWLNMSCVQHIFMDKYWLTCSTSASKKTQSRISFSHAIILPFTFADLKFLESSLQSFLITPVTFFYWESKLFFSPRNQLFPNAFSSLSQKEKSLKIRAAEILGEKNSVIITYGIFFCLKMCDMFYCILSLDKMMFSCHMTW